VVAVGIRLSDELAETDTIETRGNIGLGFVGTGDCEVHIDTSIDKSVATVSLFGVSNHELVLVVDEVEVTIGSLSGLEVLCEGSNSEEEDGEAEDSFHV